MDIIFDKLKIIFHKNGFRLYMIGGTSRDYLLSRKIGDYDFVTDAKPIEIAKFLDVDLTFMKYGTVKYIYNGRKVDITTLRKESNYNDKRHPENIQFIKDINVDFLRRDYTINAIYIDEKYQVIDPSGQGVHDLNNKILRFIGIPLERIEEDPLRILRGQRFAIEYGLFLSKELAELFKENMHLINSINPNKLKEELEKMKKVKGGLSNE